MAVSKRLRYEILRRDNHACRYCGATAPDVKLTVDHVVPVTLGGSDDPSNLVVACAECNSGKSATPPGAPLVADVAADQWRWGLAMRAAAKLQRDERDAINDLCSILDDTWTNWTIASTGEFIPRPADWMDSVEQFHAAGASDEDLTYAVRVAMNSKAYLDQKWRYFCGVVWRMLQDRQELARKILAAEEASDGA